MRTVLPALFFAFLLLFFSGEAHALSDRGVAKETLSAHSKAYKKLQRSKLSAEFATTWQEEFVCVRKIADGINSSAMGEEEKFGSAILIIILASLDYSVSASKDKPQLVQSVAKTLSYKSARLLRQSENKRGRVIARSLRGHAQAMRLFQRGEEIDFCNLADVIGDTYTIDSIENAFQSAVSDDFIKWLDSSSPIDKVINKGTSAMSRVRPKINFRRIEKYQDPVTFGFADAFPRAKDLQLLDVNKIKQAFR